MEMEMEMKFVYVLGTFSKKKGKRWDAGTPLPPIWEPHNFFLKTSLMQKMNWKTEADQMSCLFVLDKECIDLVVLAR